MTTSGIGLSRNKIVPLLLRIFFEVDPPGFPVSFTVTPLEFSISTTFTLPSGIPTTFTLPPGIFHWYPQQGGYNSFLEKLISLATNTVFCFDLRLLLCHHDIDYVLCTLVSHCFIYARQIINSIKKYYTVCPLIKRNEFHSREEEKIFEKFERSKSDEIVLHPVWKQAKSLIIFWKQQIHSLISDIFLKECTHFVSSVYK